MDGTAQLIEADRRYLVHPLHHPDDHREPLVVTEGRGAMLYDADGREYIDSLSRLWNVNVGHGREELADAAAAQMRRIAFASAYIGATNEPSVRLSGKIVQPRLFQSARRSISPPPARNRTNPPSRSRAITGSSRASPKGQDLLAHSRLSRRDHGGDERHRHGGLSQDVRAAGAELHAGRPALPLSLGRQ